MIKSDFRLLLVSDSQEYVQSVLDRYPRDNNGPVIFEIAESLSEGLDYIRDKAIEALFLRLPQPALFDALNSLRGLDIKVPVIALVRGDEKGMGLHAIKEGAHNYLVEENLDIVSLTRSIQYACESCRIAEEIQAAGQKILEYEKSAGEIESLRAIVKDYGAAAHELNQPLTALLGSIYLLGLEKDNREKISRHMERIEESGRRISDIVKKIQSLRQGKNNFFLGSASLMNPDKKLTSCVENKDDSFKILNNLFRIVQARCNGTAA